MSTGWRAAFAVAVFGWLVASSVVLTVAAPTNEIPGIVAFGLWVALSAAYLLGLRRVARRVGRPPAQ